MIDCKDMGRGEKIRSRLAIGLLFSSLGVMAWLLLSSYEGANERIVAVAGSLWACLFMVVLFVLLGFFSLRVSSWLTMHYLLKTRKQWQIYVAYAIVAILYLCIDYVFLITAKLLADAPKPFILPYGGRRMLLLVWLVEMAILGLLLANRAMLQVFQSRQRMARIEEENVVARYTALQSQLNPHFLFNSLNTLVAEIEYDSKQRAVQFTRCLADIYRYVLQVQQKRLVTLDDELNFARPYLYLHQVRLGDCVTFNVSLTDDQYDYSLPPLTLQLLLENVFKHNFVSASHPMTITLTVENDEWLVVSNNYQPKQSSDSEGVGLSNLSNRCRMIMGKAIQVESDSALFTVKIPLLYE